jgi:SpoIID/LytB domain protein
LKWYRIDLMTNYFYAAQKISSILVAFVLLLPFSSVMIEARGIDEIQQEKSQKETELSSTKSQLDQAQASLSDLKKKESSVNGELEKIELDIAKIDQELKLTQLQVQELDQDKSLKEVRKEELEKLQDIQVNVSYQSWKKGDRLQSFFGGADIVKTAVYNEATTTRGNGGILGIATEIDGIKKQQETFTSSAEDLQTQINSLNQKKKDAAAKLEAAKAESKKVSSQVENLSNRQDELESQITQLNKEEKDAKDAERNVINQNPSNPSAPKTIIQGQFYFTGVGRDLYQGHGVGMSQFGALGAAVNGWNYKSIAQFYFTGTAVSKPSIASSINVDGVGQVETETYVSGLGEIPDRACEDLGVAFNPNNLWYCWPKQAILAQVVVARTYGARRSGFIYRDTRGQVYKGGEAKRWAADATKGEVVTYNGGLADVYYSSDNSQGAGTANNDTVWSNLSGDGTVIPYLRSVNDTNFAYKTSWTNWGWGTNSYKLEDFRQLLTWSGTNSAVPSSTRNYIAGVNSTIGDLQAMGFERDPSGRVHKVVLTGSKGTKKIAGWTFKSIWNIWVGTVKPKGNSDYMYSLTYYLKQ